MSVAAPSRPGIDSPYAWRLAFLSAFCIALGGGDGGLISRVIAEGLGELLTQVGLTGLETGDHADDAIEQGSHGLDG